jgi:superfamily II DNA helicase RecQ
MHMRFFTIPIRDPQGAADELNAFLTAHRIVHTERQFVADGANSLWSICVSYIDSGDGRPTPDKRARKIDYRESLSETEFAVFAKLRALRKELADQEGVPVYALFTNEQLADMVRRGVSSLEDFKSLDGVGKARVGKYGEAFLRILKQSSTALATHAAESDDDETHHHSA